MKTRGIGLGFGMLVIGAAMLAGSVRAQEGLPLAPAVEKELAAKASDVTEVTLDSKMLGFASKFMKDKDADEAHAKKLIEGLKGIYVREYTFDKEGDYSMEQIQQLRTSFESTEWVPIVRERDRKSGETTDVMMKMVNGESQGMFVLEAAPKELTIVLILGPINMEDLGELRGVGGLGALGDLDKDKIKAKAKAKAETKDKKGGAQ